MRRTHWFFGLALAAAATPALAAQDPARPLFDSWNDGLCEVTDTAQFDVYNSGRIARIELEVHWEQGQASAPYTLVAADDKTLATGTLTRAPDCDPAAAGLCAAVAAPNLDLAAGRYRVHVAQKAICQNADSDGSGFIRIFGPG